MGEPTFDLCYSEEWPAGAQSGGLFDVVKHLFGITEITKKVFVTEYIGNKS